MCHLRSDVIVAMSLADTTSTKLKSPQPKIRENTLVTSSAISTEATSAFSIAFPGFAFLSRDFILGYCFGDDGLLEIQPDFIICSFLSE